MSDRVIFSGQHLELEEIAAHYLDIEAVLRQHFLHISTLGDRWNIFVSGKHIQLLSTNQVNAMHSHPCKLSPFSKCHALLIIQKLDC